MDSQVEAVKKNLADVAGEFVDEDAPLDQIGNRVKDAAYKNIEGIKAKSGELFKKVTEEGRELMIPSQTIKEELLDNYAKMGLFDKAGNALPHSSLTELTET